MDCNQVFMVLTRAPFPTGGSVDAPVERHLLSCESCRQIAEAFRPCESQSHERLTIAQRRHLPRYRSEVSPVLARGDESIHRAYLGNRSDTLNESVRPEAGPSTTWGTAFPRSANSPQVASFALAPRLHGGWVWDVCTLGALAMVVGAVGWGLGWLAF